MREQGGEKSHRILRTNGLLHKGQSTERSPAESEESTTELKGETENRGVSEA